MNKSREHKPEIDSFKGLLITLIVIGHNYWFSKFYPIAFNTLYNFHVVSFLLLPVITIRNTTNFVKLGNQIFRLAVPQLFFFLLLSTLYFFLYVGNDPNVAELWMNHWQLAAILQNEGFLKEATGFRHLWFLPALMTMLVALSMYFLGSGGYKKLFIFSALVLHISIGFMDSTKLIYFPWGSSLVGYIIFPALLIYYCNKLIQWRWYTDVIVIALFILFSSICYNKLLFLALAGDVRLFGLDEIHRIIFHDIVLMVSFFGMLRLAYYLRYSFFSYVGRFSMQIFLLQPLIWQLFWKFGGYRIGSDAGLSRLILVLVSIAITFGSTLIITRYIMPLKMSKIIFPKSINAFKRERV